MKTSISEFCNEFSEALFPLAEALGDTVHAVEPGEVAPAAGIAEGFANLQHRLEALINKVQGQEAYVLLFGPLKSGKSTLINALSGGYVSEVTSLPAYPCMVYLKYGPEPSYSVVRYSGKSESIASAEALKELLQKSHRTLSERIRAMDDFGEDFDPAAHLPSAIRRVAVQLPVAGLKESGTVLVDTPGLYSKMKFGYDYMTREFRDSAACAVFIVKTDNLFLEQVFSDFNDLLDQFSRVFVVVNIDRGKSDLCPDGSLEPSLESRDPDQIVKAFEVLTMSAPLRRAAESGRLHIYPIDLRGAASRRLQADAGEDGPGSEEPDRFDEFQSDLMGYLNSTDYQVEFISDSIRQSGKLTEEIIRQCSSDTVRQLQSRGAEVTAELASVAQKSAAAERVGEVDWSARLAAPLERQAQQRLQARGEALEAVSARLEALAGEWLDSDQPLQQLKEQVGKTLGESVGSFRLQAASGLEQVAASAYGGLELDAATANDIQVMGIDFAGLVATASPALDVTPEGPTPVPELDSIPVQRTLTDRLLFRSSESIRRKIFSAPDHELPAREKKKRFADHAADYIRKVSVDAMTADMDQAERALWAPAASSYVSALAEQAGKTLSDASKVLNARRGALQTEQASLEAMTSHIHKLEEIAAHIRGDIAALEEKHRDTVRQLQGAMEDSAGKAEVEPGQEAAQTS